MLCILVLCGGALTGCGERFEAVNSKLIDHLRSANVQWDEDTTGSPAAIRVRQTSAGPIVHVSLDASSQWRLIRNEAFAVNAKAGDLQIWHLRLLLPTRDAEAVSLLLDDKRLPGWNRPAAPVARSWFYSFGGFLKTGLFLALPPDETPDSLHLSVEFPPSDRLLLDLLGEHGSKTSASELRGRAAIGVLSRTSVFIPNRGAVAFSVRVPRGGRLRFQAGRRFFPWVHIVPATTMRVEVSEGSGWQSVGAVEFPDSPRGNAVDSGRWHAVDVDLSAYQNRQVKLRFHILSATGVGRVAHYVADPVLVSSVRRRRRPNVIVLVADGVRADRRPWAGRFPDLMPNLDRLAADGLEFTLARTAAPWTRASIATLFTGWLPSRHAVETEGYSSRLSASVPTLAADLRRHGYSTAAFSANPHLDPAFGLSRGFSVVDSQMEDGAKLNQRLIGYLESHPYEPFFLFGFYMDTHNPYKDRPEYSDADGIDAPVLNARALGRGWDRSRRGGQDPTPEEVRKLQALYNENVRYTDARIGEVVAALKRLELSRNTIVIFLADHGEAFGEHGDFFHGWSVFDELLRVPLIVRGPGVPRGRRLGQPVSLQSLPMLVLHWLRLDEGPLTSPREAKRILGGGVARDPIIAETRFRGSNLATLVQRPWKLILARSNGAVELYNLRDDPGEHHNLARSERPRMRRMRAKLERWLSRAAARRPKDKGNQETPQLDPHTLEQLQALGYAP